MAKEIERKVLLEGRLEGSLLRINGLEGALDLGSGVEILQGYLPLEMAGEMRWVFDHPYPKHFAPSEIRLRQKGRKYFLTVKGEGTIEREEHESAISESVFQGYWGQTRGKRVCKIRMKRPFKSHTFEIDYFTDRELILGEIEFRSLDEANSISLPGKDVTEDKQYKNKNLAK